MRVNAGTRAYWKHVATAGARRVLLLEEWKKILAALEPDLGPSLFVPTAPRARELKALEDQLDALVGAWAGIEYLAGRLEPLGDAQSAIWCPPEPAAGFASS